VRWFCGVLSWVLISLGLGIGFIFMFRQQDKRLEWIFVALDAIMDNFYMFVWSKYTSPILPKFGEKYLAQSPSPEYLLLLFKGFVNYIAKIYSQISAVHSATLQQSIEEWIQKEAETQVFETENNLNQFHVSEEVFKGGEVEGKVENPYITALEHHSSVLMSNLDNIENWASSLLEMPDIIQELLFNTVWDYHQRVDGIHSDFGRCSYINSPELSEYYWVNNEQRIEILLNLIERIRNADESLVN
jgi:hypothetical protein